jgi:hypothetical protein
MAAVDSILPSAAQPDPVRAVDLDVEWRGLGITVGDALARARAKLSSLHILHDREIALQTRDEQEIASMNDVTLSVINEIDDLIALAAKRLAS